MTLPFRVSCLLALLAITSAKEQTRWSRQISSYTSDLSDWVPLTSPIQRDLRQLREPLPIKRQAVAEPRILSEPVFQGFPRTNFGQDSIFPQRTYFNAPGPAHRQLYLQSVPAVPSAPQNYLTDQGFGQQNIRFGLSQPNFPLNQGFVSQQFPFEPSQNSKRPANPVKFESFPSIPALSPQAKPFIAQTLKKPESPKLVDGYRAENTTEFAVPKKKPQSLQKLKYENFEKLPKPEIISTPNPTSKAKSEREEVQLLYVPVESLNRGQFNFRNHQPSINEAPVQRPTPIKQQYVSEFSRPIPRPIDSFSPDQDIFKNFNAYRDFDQTLKFSTLSTPFPSTFATTPKPKKLKPHQPPLAIFLTQDARKGNQIKVGDVLSSLKNADSIAVLDSVDPVSAPKVFIGPSSLNPPENFVKFELPYLSNIDHSEKKLKQLPFFVAPLSYNTPQGFAKIPFPAPHIGSVVINAQIKDQTTSATPSTSAEYRPSSYSTTSPTPHHYRQETRPPTTKPNVSFFSTAAPKTNSPANYQSNYYSFEPQSVNPIRTQQSTTSAPRTGSYLLNNNQYNPSKVRFDNQDYRIQNEYNTREPVRQHNVAKETPSTPSTTVSTTLKASTYPNLLETHNPYSINQAYHFSTPSDYQTYFDDPFGPGSANPPPTSLSLPVGPSSSKPETVTEKQTYSSPDYSQNYSPEVHYQSEVPNSRYHNFQPSEYTAKPEVSSNINPSVSTVNTDHSQSVSSVNPTDYTQQTKAPLREISTSKEQTPYEREVASTKPPYIYNQFNYESEKQSSTTSSTTTTTTTTTTTKKPVRGKPRPRYTTTKPETTSETASKTTITRRPLRERKPLPSRNKYEPNKVTSTERATRKPADSNESTTKYNRNRTRGRVQYKQNTGDDEDIYNKKKQNDKEDDLAYQRDVLHQNYPVTIQERASTSDIEAITESLPKISSTKSLETTAYYDTDNAYSHDRAAYSQQLANSAVKDESHADASKTESQTDSVYVPKVPQDYSYQSRSSFAPVDAISSFGESSPEQDVTVKHTTPLPKSENQETETHVTESSSTATEPSVDVVHSNNEFSSAKISEVTTALETETSKEIEKESEENVVQTTPSYNRVRVRPGVVRQYHQASTTESSKTKSDRRRPTQAVTYRPAFDRRRTTMRIEEIGEDLKTKQVHARPEVQDVRHPVYRPEPTTESVTSQSTQETTTKRGVFRRRRPAYTTTSTEASATKKTYEVKSRFRGRRPTDKATETPKPEIQTETTTTQRTSMFNRFINRQRYNKKPQQEESDDQDSNYSINIPKYAEPDTDLWSPKISGDSFKPYNPNDIVDDNKTTTENQSERANDLDIITARNEFDDILISVTPATNNRDNKKIPDIPPTLEALVEQSKSTTDENGEPVSRFESMLEEVMKSLEEKDQDEYTNKVVKHKGGEIGEIPPEWINSGDNSSQTSTAEDVAITTTATPAEENHEQPSRKRGFWKKVKVRPVTETIEAAESQYLPNTVQRNGNIITLTKTVHDKTGKYDKPKATVTTYKPIIQYINDMLGVDENTEDQFPIFDIPKIKKGETTFSETSSEAVKETLKPGDTDLGIGSPEPTTLHTTTTEAPTKSFLDRSDGFSLMDYLFGFTAEDDTKTTQDIPKTTEKPASESLTTESLKTKAATTETTFIPDEITTVPNEIHDELTDFEIKKVNATETPKIEETKINEAKIEKLDQVEASSESSFTNPDNVVSTSMSTEISHETEICFRGKCIKTSKDFL